MLSYFGDVNWWALIVCTLLGMVIGYIWYGPLFGKAWGKLTGWTEDKIAAQSKNSFIIGYTLAFIAAFVIALVLAITLMAIGTDGVGDGIITAIVLWAGFTGATIGINMTFENRSLSLYAIEAGHHLIALIVYSIVLSLW